MDPSLCGERSLGALAPLRLCYRTAAEVARFLFDQTSRKGLRNAKIPGRLTGGRLLNHPILLHHRI